MGWVNMDFDTFTFMHASIVSETELSTTFSALFNSRLRFMLSWSMTTQWWLLIVDFATYYTASNNMKLRLFLKPSHMHSHLHLALQLMHFDVMPPQDEFSTMKALFWVSAFNWVSTGWLWANSFTLKPLFVILMLSPCVDIHCSLAFVCFDTEVTLKWDFHDFGKKWWTLQRPILKVQN